MDPGISIFLVIVRCIILRNLFLLIKTDSTAILSALLLRTLIVGKRQQSESIEVTLGMEHLRRLDEPF